MTLRSLASAILFSLLFVASGAAWAQETAPTTPWPIGDDYEAIFDFESAERSKRSNYTQSDAVSAQARWAAVSAKIEASPANEWAGDYSVYIGSLDYRLLRLAPDGGFVVFDVYTCSSSLYRLNFGSAEDAPTRVAIASDLANGPLSNAAALAKVKWDGAHFLIEEERMPDFLDYAAGLGKYNAEYNPDDAGSDGFLSKDRGRDALEGTPDVPEEFRHLVKRPVEAVVTAVGRTRRNRDRNEQAPLVTRIEIDAGAAEGVRKGMFLNLLGDGGEQAEVVAVRARSASADVYHYEREAGSNEAPVVSVGTKLTTRPRY